MQEFLKLSAIKESPGKYASSKDLLIELLKDHEAVFVILRKDIDVAVDKNKDAGTAGYLTGLMEQHETIAWTLRTVQHGKRTEIIKTTK